jgi:hypothetical protein
LPVPRVPFDRHWRRDVNPNPIATC